MPLAACERGSSRSRYNKNYMENTNTSKPVVKRRKGSLGEPARRPLPGIPLKNSDIAELIPKTRGTISIIADTLGCNRRTVAHRISKDPELKAMLEDARQRAKDDLEEAVWDRAIRTQDTTLQIFLLKSQCADRGYVQSETSATIQDIARAALDFVFNKSRSPVQNTEIEDQPLEVQQSH